jgi:hypothetical protein
MVANFNFYLVKNHTTAKNATTKAGEEISTDFGSLEF